MSQYKVSMSADRMLDILGTYTLDRLAANPLTAEIHDRWNMDQGRLDLANQDWKEAVRNEVRNRARRNWEIQDLRNAVRAFANRAAEIGNGSRHTAAFRTYFPNGLSAIPRTTLTGLILDVRSLLDRVEGETDESLLSAGAQLRTAVEAAEAVDAAWTDAKDNVKRKRDALEAAKIAWFVAYRRIEGELTVLHPRERQVVGSYFYRRPKRREMEAELETDSGDEGVVESTVELGSLNGDQPLAVPSVA